MKIVSDSSSDLLEQVGVAYGSVPLRIITSEKEYADTAALDVAGMLDDLRAYKGRSASSCPNVRDWLEAFEGYDEIFCVTITGGLSGSYNTAQSAAREYTDGHPHRKVFVIDSLSTGPESALIIEKLGELITRGASFEEIVERIKAYQSRTHLIFALESMHNLACNGRVSPWVAKLAGVLGIRVVGKASDEGTLEITNKVRGEEKMIKAVLSNMSANGYRGGRVALHHCENRSLAQRMKHALLSGFPKADITVRSTRGLCSFYAERGGLMIGYESGEA